MCPLLCSSRMGGRHRSNHPLKLIDAETTVNTSPRSNSGSRRSGNPGAARAGRLVVPRVASSDAEASGLRNVGHLTSIPLVWKLPSSLFQGTWRNLRRPLRLSSEVFEGPVRKVSRAAVRQRWSGSSQTWTRPSVGQTSGKSGYSELDREPALDRDAAPGTSCGSGASRSVP